MTLDLDLVPHRGGHAAVVLRHYAMDEDGHPILAVGDPANILETRQKIRKLLESLDNVRPARKKRTPKAKGKPKTAAEEKEEEGAEAPEETEEEQGATTTDKEKPPRKRKPNLSKEQETQIMDLLRQGKAYNHIAEEVGVEPKQVLRFMKRQGLV